MRIELPFTEALALATSRAPLPDLVTALRCEGSTVHASIDVSGIPSDSFAMRLAFAAAGTVDVSARVIGFESGVATVAITAHARGLAAHKLVPYLIDPIEKGMRERGLPDGLVRIQRGDPDPLLLVDVQQAVSSRTEGLEITALSVDDEVIHAAATVRDGFREL